METFFIIKAILILGLTTVALYFGVKYLQKYNGKLLFKSRFTIKINNINYIDATTKVLDISYRNRNYLVLVGKNNDVLLDKFSDENNINA